VRPGVQLAAAAEEKFILMLRFYWPKETMLMALEDSPRQKGRLVQPLPLLGYWPLAIGYWLFAIGYCYWLLAIGYWILAIM